VAKFNLLRQIFINLNLKGKKTLVCGSRTGIGKASVMELASLATTINPMARMKVVLKPSGFLWKPRNWVLTTNQNLIF